MKNNVISKDPMGNIERPLYFLLQKFRNFSNLPFSGIMLAKQHSTARNGISKKSALSNKDKKLSYLGPYAHVGVSLSLTYKVRKYKSTTRLPIFSGKDNNVSYEGLHFAASPSRRKRPGRHYSLYCNTERYQQNWD